jgi:hypothetical protein
LDNALSFGVVVPGQTIGPLTVDLQSSTFLQGTMYVLSGIQFYLDGDAATVALLNTTWPAMNGGIELSFDDGQTWIRFTQPGQRIPLPPTSVLDQLGQLQPAETAQFLLRLVVPAAANPNGLNQLRLGVEFDVL